MRVIYCAGEQGRVVLGILRAAGNDNDVVFADDDRSKHGEKLNGIPIIGGIEETRDLCDNTIRYLVAFGDRPGIRLEIAQEIDDRGYEFFDAIHPSVAVSEEAMLGRGLTINALSYVGPGANIRDHVLIDSCVNISHDVVLKAGVTVTPNVTLAGGVEAGADAYIGPGATVLEDTTIGSRAVVGAGAVVIDDVPDETTVVGVPAEPTED